jgi:hypothetical protein
LCFFAILKVTHTGSGWRISLSNDESDEDPCVLLDHIPSSDDPTNLPTLGIPNSYIPYSLTIEIPDVYCERCSLHLSNPMTDKIGSDGSPSGAGCTDPDGTCFSVYHSCTLPLKINGKIPRSEYTCPAAQPFDWPTVWVGDNGEPVDASVLGVYRREAATWDKISNLLVHDSVPDRYREDVGLCGTSTGEPTSSPTAFTNPEIGTEITDGGTELVTGSAPAVAPTPFDPPSAVGAAPAAAPTPFDAPSAVMALDVMPWLAVVLGAVIGLL